MLETFGNLEGPWWHTPLCLNSCKFPRAPGFSKPRGIPYYKSYKTLDLGDFAMIVALGNESVPLKMSPVRALFVFYSFFSIIRSCVSFSVHIHCILIISTASALLLSHPQFGPQFLQRLSGYFITLKFFRFIWLIILISLLISIYNICTESWPIRRAARFTAYLFLRGKLVSGYFIPILALL